ncbi:MAG: hypothetical protein J6I84_03270 [Bacilli bacterium]|nr:hypothetical protein [Bacilli bacterium]
MIYLIKSAAFKEGGGYETILKIGYASENSMRYRETAYRTENPTFKIIQTIHGGDLQDETNLHYKFCHLLRYGREWFSEDEEIYEFFRSHTTKESLQDLETHYSIRKQKIIDSEEKLRPSRLSWMIGKVLETKSGIDYILSLEELINTLGSLKSDKDKQEFLVLTYPDINFEQQAITSDGVLGALNTFNSFPTFAEKLRYIHEVEVTLGSEQMPLFLDSIPLKFKNYYLVFGDTRLKALEYREIEITREWERIKNNSELERDLISAIESVFKVGERYTKAQIKEKLREIYQELGYKQSPKATDLEKWFILKSIMFTNKETGKRDAGFEILSRK